MQSVVDGVKFGLLGTAEEETVSERRGGRLEDIADAWFDKI